MRLTDYDRRQRFVATYAYQLPQLKRQSGFASYFANGWMLTGDTTIQTGTPLSITGANATLYSGLTTDFAQYSGSCSPNKVQTSGKVNKRALSGFFNTSCFTSWPIIDPTDAASIRVTDYGNTGVAIARGPDEDDTDLSLMKKTPVPFPREGSSVEFHVDAFNLFNLPQFLNPDATYTDKTFGVISGNSVNPRVIQFALKYLF